MSFLHLIYVGDFERDGPSIRLARTPDDPILRPVVRRPIDPSLVERLASDLPAGGGTGVPAAWHLWDEGGYLACDRYGLGVDEILFLRRLVEEAGCRLFERGFEISVDDLTPRKEAISNARSKNYTLTVGGPTPGTGTMPDFKP